LWRLEIRRAHLKRAKHLLAQTELSMKAVAPQAGFSNFRHLAVVFRQELGMPPTAYRRQRSLLKLVVNHLLGFEFRIRVQLRLMLDHDD
jgi:transcriptional regulator GlxA family with amidase domain